MTEPNDWRQRWLQHQNQFWAALTAGLSATANAAPPAAEADCDALPDDLAPMLESATALLTPTTLAAYRRALHAGRQLLDMGDMLQTAARRTDAAEAEAEAHWRQTVTQSLALLRQHMPLTAAADIWNIPLKPPAEDGDPSSQQYAQRWSALAAECAKAHRAVLAMLDKIHNDALDLLGETLIKAGAAGAPDTLRDVYDLWVDCAETVYAQAAQSAAWPNLNADMAHALMRLQRHEDTLRDAWLHAHRLPGRRDWDTVIKRLHGARRDVRALQDALGDVDAPALRRDVQRLQAETTQLKTQLAALQAALDAASKR